MSQFAETINKSWKDIPKGARSFLKKAILLFIFWKCIYLLTIDRRLFDKPLTDLFASHTSIAMNYFTADQSGLYKNLVRKNAVLVTYNEKDVLFIGDGCNALELFVLYLGFIICIPSSIKRKILWGIMGILIIHAINILRGCGLIYLYQFHQSHFDFAHKYLFKISVYLVVFLIWMMYTKGLKFSHEG